MESIRQRTKSALLHYRYTSLGTIQHYGQHCRTSKAMKETQQVYGELKMSEMQSPVTMQKMQQVMMIANDSTLSTLLSPEDFATANKFCKENLMLDLSAAPKLKPAFLLNNVVVAAYVKHIGKFNPQEQLDTFFQSQATQNGKK